MFHETVTFCLDWVATSATELRKVKKTLNLNREVEVKVEEPICLVNITGESDDSCVADESIQCEEQVVTFSEVGGT